MRDNNPKSVLNNIEIILVNPEDSGNIGSVCRAMKTMGLTRLSIVFSRKLKKPHDENKIRYTSVHAYEIYEMRKTFSDLETAVANSAVAIAATRRKGKKRKYRTFSPEEMTDFIINEGNSTALVFGNEEKGLTDSELKVCSAAVEIPSSPDFPSLNLSHAVQILAYTIYCRSTRDYNTDHVDLRSSSLNISQIEDLAENITSMLKSIGFFRITDDKDMRIFLKDIFSRAKINLFEKEKIEKLFNKITGIAGRS